MPSCFFFILVNEEKEKSERSLMALMRQGQWPGKDGEWRNVWKRLSDMWHKYNRRWLHGSRFRNRLRLPRIRIGSIYVINDTKQFYIKVWLKIIEFNIFYSNYFFLISSNLFHFNEINNYINQIKSNKKN